jgi:hypothetical protein
VPNQPPERSLRSGRMSEVERAQEMIELELADDLDDVRGAGFRCAGGGSRTLTPPCRGQLILSRPGSPDRPRCTETKRLSEALNGLLSGRRVSACLGRSCCPRVAPEVAPEEVGEHVPVREVVVVQVSELTSGASSAVGEPQVPPLGSAMFLMSGNGRLAGRNQTARRCGLGADNRLARTPAARLERDPLLRKNPFS